MSIEEAPGFDPIDILYQDDDLLVADKPPGLLVHRSRESSDRVFLLQLLLQLPVSYTHLTLPTKA